MELNTKQVSAVTSRLCHQVYSSLIRDLSQQNYILSIQWAGRRP